MNSVIRMRRPWPVTLVAVGVFLFAAMQAAAAWQVFSQWTLLAGMRLAVTPVFLMGQAILWTGLGLASAWGLWRMHRWGLWLTSLGAPVYVLTWMIERWRWSSSVDSRLGFPFAIGLHVFGVLVMEMVLLAPGFLRRLARS